MDPRVGKTESVRYGDAVGGAAIASTEGVRVEYRATGCWVVVVTLAEQDDDTQTGFSYRIARDGGGARSRGRGRGGRRTRGADARRDQAGHGARAGAARPRRRVVVPRRARRTGCRPSPCRSSGRCSPRSSANPWRRTCSRSSTTGGCSTDPARRRSTARGCRPRRTELLSAGVLQGFLHNTYTALRGGTRSTGNARAGLPLLARRRHHEPVRRARRPLARTAPAGGGGRRARAGRERCALGREPDQRRVLGGRDRSAHLGRRARANRCAR